MKKKPEHHCNVVPAEMHTQMMNERDARLRGRDVEIADLKRLLSEKLVPQPVREGWWVKFVFLGFGLFAMALIIWNYETPAAPKGTGDAWREKCQIIWLELGCHSGAPSGPCRVLDE